MEAVSLDTEPEGSSSLENVASNFMLHVQKTETDNQELSKENTSLKDTLKEMDVKERKLEAENLTLKRELSELTGHYQTVKDENAGLLGKIAEAKREKEALLKVHEDKVTNLEDTIRQLEDSKAKLNRMTGEMDESMREISARMDQQKAVIDGLKIDLADRDDKQKHESGVELKKLKKTIRENENVIEGLKEDLKNAKSEIVKADKTKAIRQDGDEIKRLHEMLERCEEELKHQKEAIQPLEKERTFLSSELSKVKEDVKLKCKEIDDLRRKVEALTNSKKSTEKALKNMKIENGLLKTKQENSESDRDEEVETLEGRIKILNNKIEIMKTTESALAELLKSKENHIIDLRGEVTELRNISNLFKRDLDDMRSENERKTVIHDKYDDMLGAHKRILDENKKLRTMFATKSIEETNYVTEQSELRNDLDDAKTKLKSAQARVVQLEGWMDQIFKNDDYDVVLKNGHGSSRASVVSLPEISKTSNNGKYVNRKKGPPVRTISSLRELPGKYL